MRWLASTWLKRLGQRLGFTLIEIMVVVGIVALLVAIAIPTSQKVMDMARWRSASRIYLGNLRLARTIALTGAGRAAGFGGGTGTGAVTDQIRFAGVRLLSPQSYAVFVDEDNISGNGNESFVKVQSVLDKDLSTTITFTPIAGNGEVRFDRKGMAVLNAPYSTRIRIQDMRASRQYTVAVSAAGAARLEE
jgi:prepilin-type N-terminal cleavage/methylation domain-containing protein